MPVFGQRIEKSVKMRRSYSFIRAYISPHCLSPREQKRGELIRSKLDTVERGGGLLRNSKSSVEKIHKCIGISLYINRRRL